MKKKKIPCPVCGFRRLIDSSAYIETELKVEKDIKGNWFPDYYQKCPQCKNQIGIRKVG